MSPIMHEGQYVSRVGTNFEARAHIKIENSRHGGCCDSSLFFSVLFLIMDDCCAILIVFYKFRHVNLCLKPKENSGVNE